MVENQLIVHSIKKYDADVANSNTSVQINSILLGTEEELISKVNEFLNVVKCSQQTNNKAAV